MDADAGAIGGDLLCVRCGYNLIGQRLRREPTYGLVITTCPECATVATVQSYPLMTRWVNRWRALIACAWVAVLLGVFVFQVSLLVTGSAGLSGDISVPIARELGRAYDAYAVAQGEQSKAANWGGNQDGYYQWLAVTEEWMDTEGREILNSTDAWGLLRSRSTMLRMIPAAILFFVSGVFWSVMLLGSMRRRVIWVPALIAAVSVLFVLGHSQLTGLSNQTVEITRRYMLLKTIAVQIGVGTPLVLLGIWCGRSLFRAVLRMTLPPRLLGAFTWLWTRDGLDPPMPTFN